MFRVILDGADHLSGLLEIFCDTDKNLKRKLLNSTVRGWFWYAVGVFWWHDNKDGWVTWLQGTKPTSIGHEINVYWSPLGFVLTRL